MALKLTEVGSTFEYICEGDRENEANPTVFILKRESAKEVTKWATDLQGAQKGKGAGSLKNLNPRFDPDKVDLIEVNHFCSVVAEIRNIIWIVDGEEKLFTTAKKEEIREIAHAMPADIRTEVVNAASEASFITEEDKKK